MLKNIKKEKITIEEMEKVIESVYNKFNGKINEDNEYLPLWNAFITLIEFVQDNFDDSSDGDMSPAEAIELMKDLGFTTEDMKDLIKSGITNE